MQREESHAGPERLQLELPPDVDAPAAARRALRSLPLGERELVEAHLRFTGSKLAGVVLDHWELHLPQFVKVMPRDYKRALAELEQVPVSSGGDGFLTTESEGLA